jgi:6-pyruvoyltetrahydropterin/6-carboxytetrahydropterin synthase
MTSITRRYRFSASHRLHSDALSAVENERLYGKCNNPFGHGHDYILEVTAAGPVGQTNGLVLSRLRLDRLVEEKILRLFANRNLNADIPEFSRLVPTTENLALAIASRLEQNWTKYLCDEPSTGGSDGGACSRLIRVQVQETDRNGFEVLLPMSPDRAPCHLEVENVHAQS